MKRLNARSVGAFTFSIPQTDKVLGEDNHRGEAGIIIPFMMSRGGLASNLGIDLLCSRYISVTAVIVTVKLFGLPAPI